MINPLQYYKVGGRPVGIWIGGALLSLQLLMHLRCVFVLGSLPVASIFVSAPLFLAALVALLMRRHFGMWLASTFFVLGIYAPTFVISQLPLDRWWCVAAWWITSALGVVSLMSNRRWFDDRIVGFECGE